ncbi:CRP/FNR family transcriptional regulator [Gillisia sp. Hel_I_86]|uniref:Crp/Fnr family transcriptional regulator n=2 Tax=Gillisia sp. Hel_I_86 TaxID=1249981 RepID=UPI00119A0111|nr:Crp/Fnr family transcriptional regulator [Gillisia sp. Hel_I_86]TVZ28799.1 CRP/FNR family transcriptional regulator [Gillisia sp. Hel_I_86]
MNAQLRKIYKAHFEMELMEEIAESGFHKSVKEGDTLINIGNYIKTIPLLISGAIKIMRVDNNGDELLLYFLEKGHTCAMTMTCSMGFAKSEIRAVAEVNTELIMIPVQKMEEWTVKYKSWRDFVFQSYQRRLLEMLESIDSVAFHNMEERLKNYIQNKIAILNNNHIHTTHQEIAEDLHTSRVVISRLLKKMEQEHKISLHRSFIQVQTGF